MIPAALSLHLHIPIANTGFYKSPNNIFALPGASVLASSSSLEDFSILNNSDDVNADNDNGSNDTNTHPILNHHAISVLATDIRPRSRLKAKHKYLFKNNKYEYPDTAVNSRLKLFDELALVACGTGAVCRKELFETFAAAYQIHANFSQMKRIADLAAGHGLLSWFLLALDNNDDNRNKKYSDSYSENNSDSDSDSDSDSQNYYEGKPRTVICVDRRMPASADKIASAMIKRFPELESRWSYVQSDLSAVEPHPTCLLTSVHACGTLSDYLIEMAIGDDYSGAEAETEISTSAGTIRSPLAIVPCCHTVNTRKGYRPHVLSGMQEEEVAAMVEERKNVYAQISAIGGEKNHNHEAIADVVDEVRHRTLINAGYSVEEVLLPEMFTLKNRLMLGKPTRSPVLNLQPETETGYPSLQTSRSQSRTIFQRKPPSSSSDIRIPLSDDEKSIAHCHSISGREHATKRLMEQIPNHYSMSQVVSIWLSTSINVENDESESESELESHDQFQLSLMENTLQDIANQCCQEGVVDNEDDDEIECKVEAFQSLDTQASTGRRSRRFKFTYRKKDGADISKAAVLRSGAKKIHNIIRDRLVDRFGELVR